VRVFFFQPTMKPESTTSPPRPTLLSLPRRWWSAATEPFYIDEERTIAQQMTRRVLLWLPIVLPALALLAAVVIYVAIGVRARNLAAEAMESARSGGLVKARMQAMSAHGLRPRDLAVRRAVAFVSSKIYAPAALGLWEQLAADTPLTAEEAKEYAVFAMLFANDDQFGAAAGLLEKSGQQQEADLLRSARELRSGNLADSVTSARQAAAGGADADKTMHLLRVLVARHGFSMMRSPVADPADEKGVAEAADLVDALQGTKQGPTALGLGLAMLPVSRDRARTWAQAALAQATPDHPGLIPAAQFMVETGEGAPADYRARLDPVFAKASLDQRTAYAQWLNRHGFADETLGLVTAEEASADGQAYAVRSMAMATLRQWPALMEMTEQQVTAPESLRLTTRALAAAMTGRSDLLPDLVAEAVRAGAHDNRLNEVLSAVTRMGAEEFADDALLQMCTDPAMVPIVLPAARDRFAREGKADLRRQALEFAAAAAPNAPPVLDHQRRRALLDGKPVDLRDTAAALVSRDLAPRFTHALALLREGLPEQALAVIQDSGRRPPDLTPGDLAVQIAVLEANNRGEDAAAARLLLPAGSLDESEQGLADRGLPPVPESAPGEGQM
jgi:hypothetical protein